MFYWKLYCILLIFCSIRADDSIPCTKDYCKNYPGVGDSACPSLPPSCNKSRIDSGIFLPSPTPCNCCEFCIGYLSEGDSCSTGEKTSDSPTEICGPGLVCHKNSEKCVRMTETVCTKAQVKFDQDKADGKIGDYQIRPECDGNGDYVPYHCIPGGICYCVDKDGTRIFGSMDNNGKAAFELPCTCSRNHREMSIIIGRDLRPNEYFRCSQNGAYDSLQCIDEKTCLCVDDFDGTPTFDDIAPVEMWAISNNTLLCFNNSQHTNGSFYRRCEEEYLNKTKEIADKNDDYDIILSYTLPKCTPDGYYAPVQENHSYKYCSTPEGLPIEEYMLEKTVENKNLLDKMNCKCAMARRIMSSVEKPECSENGNYQSSQCRRGTCYTVDEDGNQVLE